MQGKQRDEPEPGGDDVLDDALYEATAGWDSYVSGLLAGAPPHAGSRRSARRESDAGEWEEREEPRREPRAAQRADQQARPLKREDREGDDG